jgi:hypothetical protein
MRGVGTGLFCVAILSWIAACGVSSSDVPPPGIDAGQDGGVGYVGSGGAGGFPDGSAGDAGEDANAQGGANGSDASTEDSGEPPGTGDDAGSAADADGGTGVGVTINVPPGFVPSLNWMIEGPAGRYTGVIEFGDAASYEFVVGGINAGQDYVLTLFGTDVYGGPCSGVSTPFDVSPGALVGAGVTLGCLSADGGPSTGP